MSFGGGQSQIISPTLPTPVPVGQIKGQKPKVKSTTPTILGGAQADAPQGMGSLGGGKTLLGA